MQIKVSTAPGEEFEEITLQALPGQSLAQAVYLSGFFDVPPLCSGHSAGISRCGRCRMRLEGALRKNPPSSRDIAVLGQDAVADGWRLACRINCSELMQNLSTNENCANTGCVSVTVPPTVKVLKPRLRQQTQTEEVDTPNIALAVDFGTTSVCWKFTDAIEDIKETDMEEYHMVNPQMGAGSDIMSRMSLALPENGTFGANRLRSLSAAALLRMLASDNAPSKKQLSEIVLAGNPAMIYLLLGKDVHGLCAAPYKLDYRGGVRETLSDYPGLPPCWICPLISPFVGGDLSAGYASLVFSSRRKPEYPFVLADLGTNGEFILALDKNKAIAASLPLGPALEGMGLSGGSEAREGVITGFKLTPTGFRPEFFQNRPAQPPQGLSATACLELMMYLLRLGLIDQNGHFKTRDADALPPLAKKLRRNLGCVPGSPEAAWYIDDKFYISATDTEEMLKIKAAFSLAIKVLLKEAGLKFKDLQAFYLAGALGRFISPEVLTALGFVPEEAVGRIFPVGNTSLSGAALLARQPELRDPLVKWASQAHTLSLAEQTDFHNKFTEEMFFGF
jgi:uncharacterized 2Fe-2S/4Fe-4S cluster protein (DUF4445 family)